MRSGLGSIDVPGQQWEPRLLIFSHDEEAVADAVELEVAYEPGRNARLVGCEHLTSKLVSAAADWSLEQAAAEMVRGGLRHVVVLDGSEIVDILSMRDIVRYWTSDGATCAVAR